MKVVHICTSMGGGAGLCAFRIIKATKSLGVDAKAVVQTGYKEEGVDVVKPTYPWSCFWPVQKFQILMCMMSKWPKSLVIQKEIEKVRKKLQSDVCFTSSSLSISIGFSPILTLSSSIKNFFQLIYNIHRLIKI